eukprot:4660367-Pyramimonas_sp.AAC.1
MLVLYGRATGAVAGRARHGLMPSVLTVHSTVSVLSPGRALRLGGGRGASHTRRPRLVIPSSSLGRI